MPRTTFIIPSLLAIVLLAGCTSSPAPTTAPSPSGADAGSEPAETDPGASDSAAPETVVERDLSNRTRFERLPEGDFDDLALLKEEKPRQLGDYAEGSGYAAPVFGDDAIVVLPSTQLLTVLDRESGEVRWQQRLPELKDSSRAAKEPQTLCRLAELPPGATVVTVLLGYDCNLFLHYDLATGDLIDQEQLLDDDGLSESTSTFSIARETYWVDQSAAVYRFDGAGGYETALPSAALALGPDEEATLEATVIDGTDVAVIKLIRFGGEGSDSGRYVGVRLPEDGEGEVLWSQQGRAAIQRATPRGPYSTAGAAFLPEFRGHLLTAVEKREQTPRILRFDPETGALDSGFVLPPDPDGGFPGWAIPTGYDNTLPLEDAVVSASGYEGSGASLDVTFYDYATGTIRWTHRPKMGEEFGDARADPVGVSTDGDYVYVSVSGDFDTELLELDAATGRETRRWEFSSTVTSTLNDSFGIGLDVVIDGDRMVWLARSVTDYAPYFAAVFALPPAS